MNKKIKSSRSFNETSTNVRVSDDSAADCCQWSAAAIVCIIKGSTHRKLEAISANTLFLLDTGGSYNGRHFSSSEDPDDEAANPPVKVHSVLWHSALLICSLLLILYLIYYSKYITKEPDLIPIPLLNTFKIQFDP